MPVDEAKAKVSRKKFRADAIDDIPF